jgi:cytoskeletal protein CcmA (bactofilin family)
MNAKKRTTSDLFINNLQSFHSISPNNPTTEFAGGAKIELKWESNGANFKVYKKNDTSPIYDGNNKFTTISNIFTNSTFVVKATLDGKVMYANITITIINPDLKPKSVVTANDETIKGSLTINGTSTLKNATVNGSLTIGESSVIANGDATIKKLTVNGDTTVKGKFSANSDVTLEKLTVNNDTTVNGKFLTKKDVTLYQKCTVNGDNRINGEFSTHGPVSIFNKGQLIASGTKIEETKLEVKSDGIFVVYVDCPDDLTKRSFAVGEIYSSGQWFKVLGGIVSTGAWKMPNQNTFSLPIAANTDCRYYCYNDHLNEKPTKVYFYWFPLGDPNLKPKSIRIAGSSFQSVRKTEKNININKIINERRNKADEFVSLLEQAADKKFNKAIKKELAKRLLDL